MGDVRGGGRYWGWRVNRKMNGGVVGRGPSSCGKREERRDEKEKGPSTPWTSAHLQRNELALSIQSLKFPISTCL